MASKLNRLGLGRAASLPRSSRRFWQLRPDGWLWSLPIDQLGQGEEFTARLIVLVSSLVFVVVVAIAQRDNKNTYLQTKESQLVGPLYDCSLGCSLSQLACLQLAILMTFFRQSPGSCSTGSALTDGRSSLARRANFPASSRMRAPSCELVPARLLQINDRKCSRCST